MRYLLTVSAAAAVLAFAAPAFAGADGIRGAGGCPFSAARLASLTTAAPAKQAESVKATMAEVDHLLSLPQIAALLPTPPKPADQR